jgi:acyl-[acyl-carrier-protein] desaturase
MVVDDACALAPFPDRLSARERQRLVDQAIGALYRWYTSQSQAKRNWHPDTDFAWRDISRTHSEELLTIVQGFFAVEQFAPDYTAELTRMVRKDYHRAQYYMRWGAEEAKHSDLWRNVLLATGYRNMPWIENYVSGLRERAWRPPFDEPLQMLMYTVLQERATQCNYANLRLIADGKSAKEWHRGDADPVLSVVARTIAADEVAHFEFYLAAAQIYLYYFPEKTLHALARVLAFFEMPAARIIPDYSAFIEVLYRSGVFGRRVYAVDVVRMVSEALGIKDFGCLDVHIKRLRANPHGDGDGGAVPTAELDEIANASIVERTVIGLFIRLCKFESEAGLAEMFGIGFTPHSWGSDPC